MLAILSSSFKKSAAMRCGRWQDRGTAGNRDVQQGAPNAASGILIELLSYQNDFSFQ